MTASFTSLLAEGRVETLERFMRNAVSRRRGTSPLIDLIDAEISFRDGLLDQAQALAVSAADATSRHPSAQGPRVFLAGTSALARFRVPESYALHVRALEFSHSPQDEHNALWGQCLALIYLEDDASIGATHRLSRIGGALARGSAEGSDGTPTSNATDRRLSERRPCPRREKHHRASPGPSSRHVVRQRMQLHPSSAGKVRRSRGCG